MDQPTLDRSALSLDTVVERFSVEVTPAEGQSPGEADVCRKPDPRRLSVEFKPDPIGILARRIVKCCEDHNLEHEYTMSELKEMTEQDLTTLLRKKKDEAEAQDDLQNFKDTNVFAHLWSEYSVTEPEESAKLSL